MKKMLLIILSISALLSACQTESKPFKLGVMLSLSGPYASVGVSEMYAIELAVDLINEQGGILGKDIELIIKDDQADPDLALQYMNEFYEDGIMIVIGPSLSIVVEDVVDFANSRNMLLLSPSVGTDLLTDKDDYFIRNVVTTYQEGRSITQILLEEEPSHVLFAYNTNNFLVTQYHLDGFLDVMAEESYPEENYIAMPYETGNMEHMLNIEVALIENQCDAIIIAGSNIDASPIVNYIKANQLNVDIYLTSWAMTGIIHRIETIDTDHIFGFSAFYPNESFEIYQTFETLFMERYGQTVDMVTVNAYDTIYMLFEAMNHSESFDSTTVKNAIIDLSIFQGVSGVYRINSNGDVEKQMHEFEIQEGRWIIKE